MIAKYPDETQSVVKRVEMEYHVLKSAYAQIITGACLAFPFEEEESSRKSESMRY